MQSPRELSRSKRLLFQFMRLAVVYGLTELSLLVCLNFGFADLLADLGRRNAHMRHIAERLARTVEELIVHSHQLEIIGHRTRHDGWAEFYVGRADDEAVGFPQNGRALNV